LFSCRRTLSESISDSLPLPCSADETLLISCVGAVRTEAPTELQSQEAGSSHWSRLWLPEVSCIFESAWPPLSAYDKTFSHDPTINEGCIFDDV